MVQKSDNYMELDIVLNLLKKGENHIRRIARDIGASHTTVLRKMQALVKGNVVDYKREGRNRAFHLKKTLKARNYIYMAEIYKTNKVIEKYPKLGIIMNELRGNVKAGLIVLFGSYANFTAKEDSDIDIFAETVDREAREKARQVSGKISIKIGKFDLQNNLVKEIVKNHAIVKGVEAFYERTGFFG